MAFESEWAKAIRSRAAEIGLRQADIGRLLGRSRQTGHRIWNGESRPTEEQCDELEAALMYPEGALRVLCGYLPKGSNPTLERTENGVVVRLSNLGLHLLYITWKEGELAEAGDWFSRPIDIQAATPILEAA